MPASAVAAQVCVYGAPDDPPDRVALLRVVLLRRDRARTLARLLKAGVAEIRDRAACMPDPLVIRLRSPRGQVVSYAAGGCRPAVLVGEHGASALRPWVADALAGSGSLDLSGRTVEAPDLTGLSLPRAIAAAKRRKVTLSIAHELEEPNVRFGTVVWQGPLPGARQDVESRWVSLIVATRRAPPCRSRNLEARFHQGGNGMGQHFGGAVLANTSPRPCRLDGRLRLRGRDRDARPVTRTISQGIDGPMVLSPRSAAAIDPATVPPALLATFTFFGNARDDPSAPNGTCYDHETTPSTWEIKLSSGARLRFANGSGGRDDSFYSCRGDLHFDTELNAIGATGVHLLGG